MPMRTCPPQLSWRPRRRHRARYRLWLPPGSERSDGPRHLGDHAHAVDVPGHPGRRGGVDEVHLHHVVTLPTGEPDPYDAGVAGQPSGQRALGGSCGGPIGHGSMVPFRHARRHPSFLTAASKAPPRAREGGGGGVLFQLATQWTPRGLSTVARGLAKVRPVPRDPPVSLPAKSSPMGARSRLRQITEPLSPPALNAPGRPSISIWSSKRYTASSYPTATASTSTAVTRPTVRPVVRPTFSTVSSGSRSRPEGTESSRGPPGRSPGLASTPPSRVATAASTRFAVPASSRWKAAKVATRSPAPPPSAGPGCRLASPTGAPLLAASTWLLESIASPVGVCTKPPRVPAVTEKWATDRPGRSGRTRRCRPAGEGEDRRRTGPITRTSTSADAARPRSGSSARSASRWSRTATRASPEPVGLSPTATHGQNTSFSSAALLALASNAASSRSRM